MFLPIQWRPLSSAAALFPAIPETGGSKTGTIRGKHPFPETAASFSATPDPRSADRLPWPDGPNPDGKRSRRQDLISSATM